MQIELSKEEVQDLIEIIKDAQASYVEKKKKSVKDCKYSKYMLLSYRNKVAQSIKYRLQKITAAEKNTAASSGKATAS